LSRAVHVAAPPTASELARRLSAPPEKFARADALVRLALGASSELVQRHGSLDGAGLVVGHALATLETNASFDARLRGRGPRGAEPRRFPYTSPNAVAGECGAAFGWTGPGIAVGGGLHGALEALCLAVDLVQAGDADRVVVIGVDEIGPAARAWLRAAGLADGRDRLAEGAVALVVSSEPAWARVVSAETRLAAAGASQPGDAQAPACAWGHRALLPLAASAVPDRLSSACPFGGFAAVTLEAEASRSSRREGRS
jgi:3-oxoacyl-[acyl-carrier-protein] synthase-1/3-oxoacyl-[acyl-carrier-protein] synthase II